MTTLEIIVMKKLKLEALRPLPKYTLKKMREKLLLEWSYNSNAIEGNTLTIKVTKVVLEGITIGGKTLREHFVDGNGRMARLLLNLELIKEGFPPIIIKVEKRLKYYETLDKALITEDYSDFISLVEKEVDDSLNLYLDAIK